MEELKSVIPALEQLFKSCSIDYNLLMKQEIDEKWLGKYDNQRIVNSFLFNYIKIQDKIGAKLFKSVLFELKEIDNQSVPMLDILNKLEKLDIIESGDQWDKLREIRNLITHEYPFDIEERLENISLCLEGYNILKQLFMNLKSYLLRMDLWD